MYTLGIDIGSTTSKCVILEDGERIAAKSLVAAGTGTKGPMEAFHGVLSKAGLARADISAVTATGYGRATFREADGELSELSCHGKGVHFAEPDCRTIIDIGGQDAKVIRLSDNGVLSDFVMNDKCAAGTGRFLDVMANILQLGIEELEIYAARAKSPVRISSTCTVFAESEVISQLSQNVNIDDLVAGICDSVAARTAALARRAGIKDKVCMSGGVAQNGGVRLALAKELGAEVFCVADAQYMGALGAAIAGYERKRKESAFAV